jgi:hypothetical protein
MPATIKAKPVEPPVPDAPGVDIGASLHSLGETIAERVGASDLWNKGLGQFIGRGIERMNLPKRITADDVLDAAFGKQKPQPKKRRAR